MSTPRMRTAPGALAELKKEDPGCQVTEHYIRQLIRQGVIPSVPCGVKKLIDVDKLIDHLKGAAS